MCVFTNERYKTFPTGFFCHLGHAPGVGLWGAGGAQGVKRNIQTWPCGKSNQGGRRAEHNASKIFIQGSNWYLWVRSKGQISLIFCCHVNFIFIPNFIKDRKHIFHSVARIMPQGWDLGCWGVKNFCMGICDGAPSNACSSL